MSIDLAWKLKAEFEKGGVTKAGLGRKYGFSRMTVRNAVDGLSWSEEFEGSHKLVFGDAIDAISRLRSDRSVKLETCLDSLLKTQAHVRDMIREIHNEIESL